MLQRGETISTTSEPLAAEGAWFGYRTEKSKCEKNKLKIQEWVLGQLLART